MRVSKHEEFGLRLVTRLAREGGQLTIRELAEREGLPEATIAKVVTPLREAGIIVSERGRNGGYSLRWPPADLTLAKVLAAFDDRIFDDGFCSRMNSGDGCANEPDCGIKPVWQGLGVVIGNFLAGVTVDDLVHPPRQPASGREASTGLPVVGRAAG